MIGMEEAKSSGGDGSAGGSDNAFITVCRTGSTVDSASPEGWMLGSELDVGGSWTVGSGVVSGVVGTAVETGGCSGIVSRSGAASPWAGGLLAANIICNT